MKKYFIIVGVFASCLSVNQAKSQSITPFILNATGGSYSFDGYIFDYSIGEMTLVNTFYGANGTNIIVTQGLLQNDISIPEGVAVNTLSQNLQVFPNPASNLVNLQLTSAKQGILSYRLLDVAGKTVLTNSTAVSQGKTLEQINVADIAAATYMLEVSFSAGAGDAGQSTSYKIEKLK